MNCNFLLAFSEVITHDRMRQLCSVTFCTAMVINCLPLVLRQVGIYVQNNNYKLEYFTGFDLFQAWTWQLVTLQIYVALWGSWFVCVCDCVLLSKVLL